MKMKKSLCFLSFVLVLVMALSMLPATAFAAETDDVATVATGNVAKVGNTEYATIDEAIAKWTNGTTLTLLADVTLSDVIKIKSTEHHILNLGTYTMTAASGKHAIEITCEGRSSASYALTVNADAENPGGITANGKSCIYYKKSGSTKDRPIILINNGVFTGSYSLNITSNGNTNCPQIWINGGIFNSYMNLTKCMLRVSGGTFHGAINCTGDSSAYREIKGGRFKSWQFMTADAATKFWVGSGNGNYNVGVYVDAEGYLVVGGPVITELSAEYPAVASNATKWSSYLKYSSAATYGLFYEDADMAVKKHGEANVTIWEKPAVTIPEDVTGDATVVEEIKNNTALKGYTPENLPEEATLVIKLTSVGDQIVYDVAPMNGDTKVEPTEAITFRLPVPASVTETYAKVYHEGTLMGIYAIQGEGNAKYVAISSPDFSEFAVEPITHYEVATYEELIAALANDGAYVVMTADITATATQSSGYGKAGIVVDVGDILDGNGKTLTIKGAGATWDCAIAVRGGEVKNLTIAGAMRGIFMPGANGDVVIDNCVFENVIYTFNSDAGSKDYTVTIKNTTLNGWTSFSNAHKTVTFESCTFGKGSGYAFCRPYQATTFVGCEFAEGYEFDTKSTTETLAFNDCTYNGEALSATNREMFYNGGSVVIDGVATDVTPPKGDASVGYVSTTTIWGECGGNAKESFIIKIYSGDTYLGYTRLNDIDGILDGDVWVTWHAMLIPENETDSYWTTVWEVELTSNKAPTKIELWIDGVCVDTGDVQMNGPDNLNPVKWEELGGVKYVCTGLKGSGTEADPYKISRVEDLIYFRNSVNDGETTYNAPGVYVVLTADIDLGSVDNWAPIGNWDYTFDGNFNGNGHVIKNLKMSDNTAASGEAYLGFFGITANNVIENFVIENVTINTNGQIVAAAIAYPYYTTVKDITVCGDIAIKGGNYTAGVLAYTRLCQNASNLTVSGNAGSYITGAQVVGGVIADIQMNHGLVANYSKFSASGVTITGEKSVGGISGIICNQTLNDATVKNVTMVCSDARVGIVAGSLGGTSTVKNIVTENVTGATATVGACYDSGYLVVKSGDVYSAVAPVAEVNGVNYATLSEAIKAATAGQTITLLADVNENVTINKNLTIDGAEKNYTGNMKLSANKGTVTIKNVNFDGKGYNGYAVDARGVYYLTIEDCTAKNYGYGFVQTASSTVCTTLKNVTISDMTYGVKIDYSNEVVLENVTMTNVKNGILDSNYGNKTYTITNSKITSINTWERDNKTGVATFKFEGANEVATLSTSAYAKYVGVQIGTKIYDSLANAWAAAQNGDTIKLLSNITVDTETFTVADGKKITLDMNGKKITVTDNATGNYELFYIYGEMIVTGEGVIELTATYDRDWNASSGIFHNRGGVLTIENGTFTHIGGSDMAFVVDNSGNWFGDAVTNINGGTLTSSYIAIRNRMEQNTHGASGKAILNVYGGKINGTSRAIWAQAASTSTVAPATGEINISGGEIGLIDTARSAGAVSMTTITGGTVASFKGESGELTVNGGTITGDITILFDNGDVPEATVVKSKVYYGAVAKINKKYYATLADAVKANTGAQAVTLIRDIEAPGFVVTKKMTLDFNGHILTLIAPAGDTACGIQIDTTAAVRLLNGTLKAADDAGINVLVESNGSALTIQKQTLVAANIEEVLVVNSGSTSLNYATIKAEGDVIAFEVYGDAKVTVYSSSTITGTINAKKSGPYYYAK